MKLVNLTPHALNLFNLSAFFKFNEQNSYGESKKSVIKPSGEVARLVDDVERAQANLQLYDGSVVEVVELERTGKIQGLPEAEAETIYIVSQIVAAECTHRSDVYFPYPLIRDDNGRVVGAGGLANFAKSAKDITIHNLSLDIARLQGCHVEDSEYRSR